MDASAVVSIIDDDESLVRALGRLVDAAGYTTRTWTSARAFLQSLDPEEPGCIVTDLVMPDMTGLELQRELIQHGCCLSLVFVTGRGDITTTVQGMKAGAVSFLPKPVRGTELLAAVREALETNAERRTAALERRRVRDLLSRLTPREREVLELVATGMLNKQIAARLGAAEKTIKVHRGRLMEKMHVRSAAALVHLLVAADLPGSDKHIS